MMTPSRVVRLLGILGLVAWFGMVGWAAKSSLAQNGGGLPTTPSSLEAAPPSDIAKEAGSTASAPIAPVGGDDLLEGPPPLPAVTPTPVAVKPAAKPAPPTPPTVAAAPTAAKPVATEPPPVRPKAPVPTDPAAVKVAAPGPKTDLPKPVVTSPLPIARSAAIQTSSPIPVAPAAATVPPPDDPERSARSFVERSAREAEEHLKALSAEADELRGRLEKLESGIKQWEGVLRALKGSRHPHADEPSQLDPVPAGTTTTSRTAARNRWVGSTPARAATAEPAPPTASVSSEADPSPYLPAVTPPAEIPASLPPADVPAPAAPPTAPR